VTTADQPQDTRESVTSARRSRELKRAAMRGEKVERVSNMPQICHDTARRIDEEDWIDGMKRCLEDPWLRYENRSAWCAM
jgi:hypothetical protein